MSKAAGVGALPRLAVVGLLGLAWAAAAAAQDAPAPAHSTPAPPQQHVKIAFIQVDDDARYVPIMASGRIVLKSPEHPFAGAQVSIDDAAPLERILSTDFALDRIAVKSSADVAPAIKQAADAGTHFFLIDAPAEAYPPLATAMRGRDVLLFNVSEPDDALRRQLCAPEFVHVYPSRAQLMDGLVQYVVSRKWTNLLELQGPSLTDAAMTAAFEHSAKKFGARIVAQQKFEPGTDPRQREHNDPALLSAINRDFDVVFIADSDFDFARTVPYHLVRPRPVIGSIDLEPVAWHWTWDHNGAPQVNSRFEKRANGRRMEGADWAAWVAAKMIVQAVLHTRSTDFTKDRAFILGVGSFDGDKGLAVSVRPWDHQVRQAVLLAAPYEVVASAPIEGFLHQTNDLDTLGDDEPESPCHLDR
jgi:ABC transporter substrate binding protein (PQQ-dependent alcohol dehydrogenase system)